MANWSNVRVLMAGPVREISRFRREARPYLRFAKGPYDAELPDALASANPLFHEAMLHGECGNLFHNSFKRLTVGAIVEYGFQTAHSEEIPHFRKVSRRFPTASFVVGWGEPNCCEYGSALISQGRVRRRRLSANKVEEIYGKFILDPDDESDLADLLCWEAEESMLDHCMEFWNEEVFQDRGKRRVRPQPRRL